MKVEYCQLGTIVYAYVNTYTHLCATCTRQKLGRPKCTAWCVRCLSSGRHRSCDLASDLMTDIGYPDIGESVGERQTIRWNVGLQPNTYQIDEPVHAMYRKRVVRCVFMGEVRDENGWVYITINKRPHLLR